MFFDKKKIKLLNNLFGDVQLSSNEDTIRIKEKSYKVIDGVIIYDKLTNLGSDEGVKTSTVSNFGDEWNEFSKISREHYDEFDYYFSEYDYQLLENKIFCDLGCGIGRWSRILSERVDLKFLILCDFSDAIFVARKQLAHLDNVIFIKCDLDKILFNDNVIDFFICLGVLHHLPDKYPIAVKNISSYCPEGIIYLYYSLENRGKFFNLIFTLADMLRKNLFNIKSRKNKIFISHFLTLTLYYPFKLLNKFFNFFFKNIDLPLSFYKDFSYGRIVQDSFDRFFTNVEHRYSRQDINTYYSKFFHKIKIFSSSPYWCFHVKRK